VSKQRVYKLTFPAGETEMSAELPAGAPVIHFAAQGNNLCLWYVDRDDTGGKEQRRFSIRGTGHSIDGSAAYVDTAFLGPFVFHLFETPTNQKEA